MPKHSVIKTAWTDPASTLLGPDFPLPLDKPFTVADGRRELGQSRLESLHASGRLRRVIQGVYAAAQAPDSVLFRAAALALVLPEHAVVCDRTAGWLHGIPILQRGAHLEAPKLDVCDVRDTRVRRPEVRGVRRGLAERDIMTVNGVRATTPVRTGCDLGRLLWRFDALAALDGVRRAGVGRDELIGHTTRFAGYRGVKQLRALAVYADPLAESPGESALRLHWIDAFGIPPKLQVPVLREWSGYRLDMGLDVLQYAAEYDGEEFHSSPEDRARDAERRSWLEDEAGWVVDVFTKDDVYSPRTDIVDRLKDGAQRARRARQRWNA